MCDPAIFFDRDGTINIEKDFISDPRELELIDTATEALKLAAAAGYKLFVVSNQSGIARGIMTAKEVDAVNARLVKLLGDSGIVLDGVYYCPHHPKVSGPCACRKPNRGMIDQALQNHSLDLSKSYVIGDRLLDIELARNVGAGAVMVLTGYGSIEINDAPKAGGPDYIAADILEGVKWIVGHHLGVSL
jgi:histidinol-phosphate phosphatase family protein